MCTRWLPAVAVVAVALAVGLVWWSPSLAGGTRSPGAAPRHLATAPAPSSAPATPTLPEHGGPYVLTDASGGTAVTADRAGASYRLRLLEPRTPRGWAGCGERPARALRLCARTADHGLLLLTVRPAVGARPTAERILRDPRLQHAWALGRSDRRDRAAAVLEEAVGRRPSSAP